MLLTDPPYGINYSSSSGFDDHARRVNMAKSKARRGSVAGDGSVAVRDNALELWNTANKQTKPAAVFGSWRQPHPKYTRYRALCSKHPDDMRHIKAVYNHRDEEIYIWGKGWEVTSRAPSNIITPDNPKPQAVVTGQIGHPTPKPTNLLEKIINRTTLQPGATIADPFAGSGSTLIAAKLTGMKAVGIELEEKYCELIALRAEHWDKYGCEITRKWRYEHGVTPY